MAKSSFNESQPFTLDDDLEDEELVRIKKRSGRKLRAMGHVVEVDHPSAKSSGRFSALRIIR
jgi:hypothetical protein